MKKNILALIGLFACNTALLVSLGTGAGVACSSESTPVPEIPMSQLATINELRSMCISSFEYDDNERRCLDITSSGSFQLRMVNACARTFVDSSYDSQQLNCLSIIRDRSYTEADLNEVGVCGNQSSSVSAKVNCFDWFGTPGQSGPGTDPLCNSEIEECGEDEGSATCNPAVEECP